MYGNVKYDASGSIPDNGRTCEICPGNEGCANCKGPEISDCIECKPGYYLSLVDSKSRSGSCFGKKTGNPSINIYVSNLIDESVEPGRARAGTFGDPVAQLEDAFTIAQEMASNFKADHLVKVLLFKGTHYMYENRFDAMNLISPVLQMDTFALNIDMLI
jgi:hypothetical protein